MSSGSAFRRPLVARQFHRARRQAAVESLLARLSGGSADLLSYNDVIAKLGTTGQSPAGLRQIPVAAIVGSVGRYQDFTRTFLPRLESDEDRWVAVGAAARTVADLPPIEVYKVGDAYFVLDGNHRVSIARRQGIDYIDALVTEVRTRVPLPPGAKPDAMIIAAENAAFLDTTRLDVNRLDVDMQVSVPGQYYHLENYIEAWRYLREMADGEELSLEIAAAGWYDDVYLPLVQAIREHGILRYFPGRTETDFFVWLARHRTELERELGWSIPPDVAVTRLLSRVKATEPGSGVSLRSRLRRLTLLAAPDRIPQPNWVVERTLSRYSEHLFASILLPIELDRPGAESGGDEVALKQAIALSLAEEAQLHVIGAVAETGSSAAAPAIERVRSLLAEQEALGLNAHLEILDADPAERVIELAFINDLIVLDRRLAPPTPDEPVPTTAVRHIIARARRPVFIAGEQPAWPIERILLVHDTRRKFDEGVFIAAYLAENRGVELRALPVGNGRNTAEVAARVDDYLMFHEINAIFLDPTPLTASLVEAIFEAGSENNSDLIVLPAAGPGLNGRRPDLTETILGVVQRWSRAILIAG